MLQTGAVDGYVLFIIYYNARVVCKENFDFTDVFLNEFLIFIF